MTDSSNIYDSFELCRWVARVEMKSKIARLNMLKWTQKITDTVWDDIEMRASFLAKNHNFFFTFLFDTSRRSE